MNYTIAAAIVATLLWTWLSLRESARREAAQDRLIAAQIEYQAFLATKYPATLSAREVDQLHASNWR